MCRTGIMEKALASHVYGSEFESRPRPSRPSGQPVICAQKMIFAPTPRGVTVSSSTNISIDSMIRKKR